MTRHLARHPFDVAVARDVFYALRAHEFHRTFVPGGTAGLDAEQCRSLKPEIRWNALEPELGEAEALEAARSLRSVVAEHPARLPLKNTNKFHQESTSCPSFIFMS